jgi:hypothetical protein
MIAKHFPSHEGEPRKQQSRRHNPAHLANPTVRREHRSIEPLFQAAQLPLRKDYREGLITAAIVLVTAVAMALVLRVNSAAPSSAKAPRVATQYRSAEPPLTPVEVRKIREMLALVRPCQRALLRYVLWKADPSGVVLFFEPQPPDEGAHILGEAGEYYTSTNGVITTAPDDPSRLAQQYGGIRWDIDRQRC